MDRKYARTDICVLDDKSYLLDDTILAVNIEKVINNTIKETLLEVLKVNDIEWADIICNVKTKGVRSRN